VRGNSVSFDAVCWFQAILPSPPGASKGQMETLCYRHTVLLDPFGVKA
jgi:hypothetical protein